MSRQRFDLPGTLHQSQLATCHECRSAESVRDRADRRTSTGKWMEGVLAAFAQFDNDVRSDRTRAGMKAALELGRWVFLAPIGYLNARGLPAAGRRDVAAYGSK
jgi:DNA invertase Pin-like site-specific DNA recombinase